MSWFTLACSRPLLLGVMLWSTSKAKLLEEPGEVIWVVVPGTEAAVQGRRPHSKPLSLTMAVSLTQGFGGLVGLEGGVVVVFGVEVVVVVGEVELEGEVVLEEEDMLKDENVLEEEEDVVVEEDVELEEEDVLVVEEDVVVEEVVLEVEDVLVVKEDVILEDVMLEEEVVLVEDIVFLVAVVVGVTDLLGSQAQAELYLAGSCPQACVANAGNTVVPVIICVEAY